MVGVQAFVAFAETAKRGGFAAAARELGLGASAVAKSVARLEAELGLRLFHRTTRQVSLTSDGRRLYARCQRLIDELEALRADAEGVRAQPSGRLRIDAPLALGRELVVPALARLALKYPKLAFDVSFSDRYIDPIREGVDAVVRAGHLDDSSLVARRIGEQHLVACASPRYLRKRGAPKKPAELADHDVVMFRLPSTGRPRPLQFRDGRRQVELAPDARFVLSDGDAMLAAIRAGLGIAQLPDYYVARDIAAGQLVEVLQPYRPAPMPISLLYPSHRQITPRLRALIDALV